MKAGDGILHPRLGSGTGLSREHRRIRSSEQGFLKLKATETY
jgi:hypothetical protein